MGDLTTILGIQLGQKLNEIQNALGDGASYLAAQGRKGGQRSSAGRTRAIPADDSSLMRDEGDERVLPDAAVLLQRGRDVRGNEGFFRKPAEPTNLPPANGDPIVAPQQPLIDRRGYLTQQVPVMNEKGQMVAVMGPQGAPTAYLQNRPEDVITPIPNEPQAEIDHLRNTPYITPKDQKTKGVFLKHIKSMYEQMLQQMGTLT